MLVNLLFLISQVVAEVEAPHRPLKPKEGQDQNEKLDRTSIQRLDHKSKGVCSDIRGRRLFRSAIIGLPVGTVLTMAGGVLVLASIDSNVSNAGAFGAIGTVYAGLGTLAFSSIALPISVHMLHEDALKKRAEPSVQKGALFAVDGMIVAGYLMSPVVLSAPLLVPVGYIIKGIQGKKIIDSIQMKRKRVC